MSSIPILDTGPGLSGFLASLLSQVYAYLPSSGRHDWLLLFLFIGVIVHFAFLPYLWKVVESDMIYLQKGMITDTGASQGVYQALWALVTLLFLLWFFHTAAGHTLLAGRRILSVSAIGEAPRGLYWISLITMVVTVFLSFPLSGPQIDGQTGDTHPYSRRTLLTLYAGGGNFVMKTRKGIMRENTLSVISYESLFFTLFHVFYWRWSTASLLLMDSFLVGAVLADACRMSFVYIHHKRTFG